MKKLITVILIFLFFVGCADGQAMSTGSEVHDRETKLQPSMAASAMLELVTNDDDTVIYPYNFGGAYYEKDIDRFIIMVSNDDYSPYRTILNNYDGVEFKKVDYSIPELEKIQNDFLVAHPEIEYKSAIVVCNESVNVVSITLSPLYYEENIDYLQSLTKELPIVFEKNTFNMVAITNNSQN